MIAPSKQSRIFVYEAGKSNNHLRKELNRDGKKALT
jgi:hypothetical protein